MKKAICSIFVLVICSCCVGSIDSQQTPLPKEIAQINSTIPDGWVLFPNAKIDDSALQCANYSRREWRVDLVENNVNIGLDKLEYHQAPLPETISSRDVKVGIKGDRSVVRVADGWLVGTDVGEFGGGLWWFSSDGKANTKLSSERIVGFAKTPVGLVALAGLAHMSFNDGKILMISEDTMAERKIEVLAELYFAPRTFVAESSESLLILTTDSLVRFNRFGKIEKLFSTRYQQLYPTSMIVTPSGIVYIGMRHFVTRLTPKQHGYDEEWFVPSDCTKFRVGKQLDCLCLSK